MEKIETGNLNTRVFKNPESRGWFLGHFIDSSSIFHSSNAEIKWGLHKKGEKYKNTKANIRAKSLAILISGKISISFPDENKISTLEKSGDFVIWEAGIYHTAEFLEDTTLLTIRWPSIPNDVIKK